MITLADSQNVEVLEQKMFELLYKQINMFD